MEMARIVVILALVGFNAVKAAMFVEQPFGGSTCHANQPCTVTWLDDGSKPLVSDLGICDVGLYTGQQQLVQQITPVDVSTALSLKFTPNPKAGPNSNGYYIAFTCPGAQINGSDYLGFSPFFKLDQMTGSFSHPDPSATKDIPVPISLSSAAAAASASAHSAAAVGATGVASSGSNTLSLPASASTASATLSGFSTVPTLSPSSVASLSAASTSLSVSASNTPSGGASQAGSGAGSRFGSIPTSLLVGAAVGFAGLLL